MNKRKAEDLAVTLLQVESVIDQAFPDDIDLDALTDVASTLKRLLVEECTGMDTV